MNHNVDQDSRQVLTVGELTRRIKTLLERDVGEVWVKAEISNLRIPASGHAYFTLKDESSQISGVLFKGRRSKLRFEMADGQEVIGFGKISVYEPRGSYQIILEYVEPAGLGALQAAFEQLKAKLQKEGLFESEHKKPLPFFPRRIGVVTSQTGAAIRDILNVLARRNPLTNVVLAPAKVQGEGSAEEVAAAIQNLNAYNQAASPLEKIDLLIVGRGGGSLEDLWAFNEEVVARAIFDSEIPVISAVGHEIDFTISDFVADVRAPTPSAAAELAVPVLSELKAEVYDLKSLLRKTMFQIIADQRQQCLHLSKRLVRPDRRLNDLRLRLDDWQERLCVAINAKYQRKQERFFSQLAVFLRSSPQKRLQEYARTMANVKKALGQAVEKQFLMHRARFESQAEHLNALSPLKILGRGYAVVRHGKDQRIVKKSQDLSIGDAISVLLSEGQVQARVETLAKGKAKSTPTRSTKKTKARSKNSDTQGQFWS